MGVPFTSKGDGKGKAQIEVNADKNKCEKSPAGHYIKTNQTEVCVYLYDENNSPMEDIEIEDLTPSGIKVRDKNTGQTGEVEV